MLIFFILIFITTTKAKEETKFIDLLLDKDDSLLDIQARRLLFNRDLSNKTRQESVHTSAKLKKYHVNGTIPVFHQYYRKRIAEQEAQISEYNNEQNKMELIAEIKTVQNLRALFKEWEWYTEYSYKLEPQKSVLSKDFISLVHWHESLLKTLFHHYEFIQKGHKRYSKIEGIENLVNDLEKLIVTDHERMKAEFQHLDVKKYNKKKLEDEERDSIAKRLQYLQKEIPRRLFYGRKNINR